MYLGVLDSRSGSFHFEQCTLSYIVSLLVHRALTSAIINSFSYTKQITPWPNIRSVNSSDTRILRV